jgi:uncharacterized protein YbbC (DUF1343 family)
LTAWRSGLDRVLEEGLGRLAGRRYGLLAHAASLTADLRPAHLALAAAGRPPAVLFAPEHGYYGVEQDMVAAADQTDPWTGVPIRSLYGDGEATLRPAPRAFTGLDLLVVDLQDVGARYYTYAATAVWAAEVALAAGCEVWLLDRPNPLPGAPGGGVEGNLPDEAYRSFVGAFRTPVCHGLTLGELMRLEAARRGWERQPEVWPLDGWRRRDGWGGQGGPGRGAGRPWMAPSPNMPDLATAAIYPGLCLVEASELSEGRGTTRPFRLLGAPGLDPQALAHALADLGLPGVAFVPTYFRPQFQKHAGKVCGGVEILVVDPAAVVPFRLGVEVLFALRSVAGDGFAWRRAPYEFVSDRPAVDLLAGSDALRHAVDSLDRAALDAWIATWPADEAAFRQECEPILLYPS